MSNVLMIAGGKGHGKDTFYKDLINNTLNDRWVIYGNKSKSINLKDIHRLSFADKLKFICWKELTGSVNSTDLNSNVNSNQLTDILSIEDIDKYKEVNLSDIPNSKFNYQDMTFRDYLILYAMNMRNLDKDYWVRECMKNYNIKNNVAITDFRFTNEYDYIYTHCNQNIITFRVFRSNIPLSNDISEINLNNFITDFLVLPKYNYIHEFNECLKHYPQYHKFQKIELKL